MPPHFISYYYCSFISKFIIALLFVICRVLPRLVSTTNSSKNPGTCHFVVSIRCIVYYMFTTLPSFNLDFDLALRGLCYFVYWPFHLEGIIIVRSYHQFLQLVISDAALINWCQTFPFGLFMIRFHY